MSSSSSNPSTPRVLLVNDDGPCSPSSPHILGFWTALQDLGWKVDVCVPSAQKSWSGMATTIHSKIAIWYYYPKRDNHQGINDQDSWSPVRREIRHDEVGEWVLVDASPSTCTNIGLFSSVFRDQPDSAPTPSSPGAGQPKPEPQPQPPAYDLVVSGPNYGRNTGTAFALSSGTLGAAMAGSLAGVKSISISYGHFQKLPKEIIEAESRLPSFDPSANATANNESASTSTISSQSESEKEKEKEVRNSGHLPPSNNETTRNLSHTANLLCAKLVQKLYAEWEEQVDCYSINVPLCRTLEQPEIIYTRMWDSKYGRLFRPTSSSPTDPTRSGSDVSRSSTYSAQPSFAPPPQTHFQFGPDMAHLLSPKDLKPDTDVWALMNGYVSITRLGANFEKRGMNQQGRREGEKWKL